MIIRIIMHIAGQPVPSNDNWWPVSGIDIHRFERIAEIRASTAAFIGNSNALDYCAVYSRSGEGARPPPLTANLSEKRS